MICSPTRLVASARIVKLIFADPILIVVTAQTVSTPTKSVEFRGRVVGASLAGNDRIVVLSADGILHLYNLELDELITRKVGLPNEWAGCEHTFVTSNAIGSTVAFGQSDNTVKIYSVANNEFNYVGSVDVHKETKHCTITNGLPGAPGLLLAFSSTFVKVVEISAMMPTISTCRISSEPILFIYPLLQDGDCLLISRNRVRTFAIRNILIGKFELPVAKLPAPLLAASSTRLKSGVVHNMVICGSKLFELVLLGDGKIEPELVCRLPDFIKPNIDLFFCLSGAGLWLVRWFGRGTRGQFMINEEERECRQLEPEYELDFDAKDFLIDTTSNSIVSFGRQPNLDFVSKCLALNDLIEPISAPIVSEIIYEPLYNLVFVVYPSETHVLHLNISDEGLKLKHKHIIEGRCLVASSYMGMCTCIFENKRVYLSQYDFKIMDSVDLPSPAISAQIVVAKAAFCTLENKVYWVPLSNPSALPQLLFESEVPVSSLHCLNHLEFLYSTSSDLMRFNTHTKTSSKVMEAQRRLEISDLVYFNKKYYAAYRDGYISISGTCTGRDIMPTERIIKLDEGPIKFILEGEKKLLARGSGLWFLNNESFIPVVHREGNRHNSFARLNIAGACAIPQFDLTLIIAYDNQIRIISTQEVQFLTSKPQVESFPVSKVIVAIEKGVRFRAWIVATENGLEFYDMKHRTNLKADTDLSPSEKITALRLWEIERDGTMYTHLAIGVSRSTPQGTEYMLRSCTIKRDRNGMCVKKRLKVQMPNRVSSITTFQNKLLAAAFNQIVLVSYSKERGLSVGARMYSAEGSIQEISVVENECTLSTTKGLIRFDLGSYKLLTDPNHMVNRMRDCICHISCTINNKEMILLAQKDCFLQVMELESGIWRVVERIDANERILRMHHITGNSIEPQETMIIALTNMGSFLQLKMGDDKVEAGPYLF